MLVPFYDYVYMLGHDGKRLKLVIVKLYLCHNSVAGYITRLDIENNG
jgi:hypothetical protein